MNLRDGSDEPRLALAKLGDFYSHRPYPWPPLVVERPLDDSHATALIAQDLGDFSGALPSLHCIWIAGCGTNQAAITALRFPLAKITATDVSAGALNQARELIRDLGIENVTFREEPLEETARNGFFDYIISTGVIHHNHETVAQLRALSRALKSDGLIELMVYNAHHRTREMAVQRAMRLLQSAFDAGGPSATELIETVSDLSQSPQLVRDVRALEGWPSEAIADQWLNPYESPFTVHRLAEEADQAGLQILAPCRTQHDRTGETGSWFLDSHNPLTAAALSGLADVDRWQLAQDLGFESSPMLWFYLGAKGLRRWPTSESERIRNMVEATFTHNAVGVLQWRRQTSGSYKLHGEINAPPRVNEDGAMIIKASSLGRDRFGLVLDDNLSEPARSRLRWDLTTGARPPLLSYRRRESRP